MPDGKFWLGWILGKHSCCLYMRDRQVRCWARLGRHSSCLYMRDGKIWVNWVNVDLRQGNCRKNMGHSFKFLLLHFSISCHPLNISQYFARTFIPHRELFHVLASNTMMGLLD